MRGKHGGSGKVKETTVSHLDILKSQHPGFNWPKKGERGKYPEDIGTQMGDKRFFGFPPRRYRIVFRTSNEESAKEFAEGEVSKGNKAQITYSPIKFETYGIWVREEKVKANREQSKEGEDFQSRSNLPRRRKPRITPKTPRLRR